MRRSIRTAAAAVLTCTALTAAGLTPASASTQSYPLCRTIDTTPAYEYGNFTGYVFSLSGDRGFRASDVVYSSEVDIYSYRGHGAEHPDHEVWVRAQHIACS